MPKGRVWGMSRRPRKLLVMSEQRLAGNLREECSQRSSKCKDPAVRVVRVCLAHQRVWPAHGKGKDSGRVHSKSREQCRGSRIRENLGFNLYKMKRF